MAENLLRTVKASDIADDTDFWQLVQDRKRLVIWRIGHRTHSVVRITREQGDGLIAYFNSWGSDFSVHGSPCVIKPHTRLKVCEPSAATFMKMVKQ
jgi:hypothetical protein